MRREEVSVRLLNDALPCQKTRQASFFGVAHSYPKPSSLVHGSSLGQTHCCAVEIKIHSGTIIAGIRELGVLGEEAWAEENVGTGPVRGSVFDLDPTLPGGDIGEIDLRWQPRSEGRR